MSVSLLEQASPAAATNFTLYDVPGGYAAKVAAVTMCNTSGAARTVRLAIVRGGGTTGLGSWVLYDAAVPAAQTLEWYQAEDLLLDEFDSVRIYCSGTGMAFGLFGTLSPAALSAVADQI